MRSVAISLTPDNPVGAKAYQDIVNDRVILDHLSAVAGRVDELAADDGEESARGGETTIIVITMPPPPPPP